MGLGDIFSSFFGGGFGSKAGRQSRARDVETTVSLDFEEAVFGTEKNLKLNIQQACGRCQGARNEPGSELKRCETCGGRGRVVHSQRTILGTIQQEAICSTCQGEGVIPEKLCSQCGGSGVEKATRDLNVKIPSGIDDGSTIRLRNQGEQTAKGSVGDLYVNVRVKPHKHFTREGSLILSEQDISMLEATLGAEIQVNTVDGPVTMKIPPGTQSGTDFKLRGHGVPKIRDTSRGDHIVRIKVLIPTKLNKEQKALLEKFADEEGKRFWKK
jgi:molecular chaperone DnaJ